jgi:hypothetical protein
VHTAHRPGGEPQSGESGDAALSKPNLRLSDSKLPVGLLLVLYSPSRGLPRVLRLPGPSGCSFAAALLLQCCQDRDHPRRCKTDIRLSSSSRYLLCFLTCYSSGPKQKNPAETRAPDLSGRKQLSDVHCHSAAFKSQLYDLKVTAEFWFFASQSFSCGSDKPDRRMNPSGPPCALKSAPYQSNSFESSTDAPACPQYLSTKMDRCRREARVSAVKSQSNPKRNVLSRHA